MKFGGAAQLGLHSVLWYGLVRQRNVILGSIIVVVLTAAASPWDEGWWGFVEPVLAVVVVAVALMIWMGEARQDLENSLPKRLNVRFVDMSGNLIMRCRGAYLAGEGDIRAWGQQIGRQMAGNRDQLEFYPDIRQEPGELREVTETDEVGISSTIKVKEYTVTFRLRDIPARFRGIPSPGEGIPYFSWGPEEGYELENMDREKARRKSTTND